MAHDHPVVPRTNEEQDALMKRLKRIEGQVRGIANMVAEDRYCIDILTQTASIQAALRQVELQIIERHVKMCMHEVATRQDSTDAYVDELMAVIARLKK
ncbi:metal-sensitive transcriptional regulator [Exiguobacterium indicum]|uniref:metal-sensitive transcriptional regulator n=1 Tax=Exiguobacterium indicum TaxID=296995 RepID=UPI00094F76D2|nr:metal-sensitive transcriptional regulator [Exiguobacterium indicum]